MSGEGKRLRFHAYFRGEIWVILHKCWILFFFTLREQSTVLAPWEEHLPALHHPAVSSASPKRSKTQWGRSGAHYKIVYVLCIQVTSCFCSLLHTPSWKQKEKPACPHGQVLSAGEQWSLTGFRILTEKRFNPSRNRSDPFHLLPCTSCFGEQVYK